MNLDGVRKIYFVGIGGVGMAATAGIARGFGYEVFGSDNKALYSPAKDVLDEYGIEYFTPYSEENVKKFPADLYIVSAGEDLNNPEVAYLENNNIEFHSFSELLYELYKDKLRVVVAGTHGKSTTSGMIGYSLKHLDDSSFMVGGVLINELSNFYAGEGHYVVFEGDEYKSLYNDYTPKFHYYKPDILVLNNLEFDHPDMYENFEAMKDEFGHLIANMPEDGLIIYNADDKNLVELVHKTNVANFGFSFFGNGDFNADNLMHSEGGVAFKVMDKRKGVVVVEEDYFTQLAGDINVRNCLATITMLRVLGFEHEKISETIGDYLGIKRRFEKLGTVAGVTIIDDYAHHPTAVRETIEAARLRYPRKKIWAVFEPHTFSRTKETLHELVKSFDSADAVLISEIYPAREKVKDATITGDMVVAEVLKHKKNVRLVHDKEEAKSILKTELKNDDLVVVMAVGNFNRLGYELISGLDNLK
jgi:UDP-N-acetylmuramate--L-alanine ligase